MWVILPVKSLQNAKLRLADELSPDQRRQLGVLMLHDMLETLSASVVVAGVTVISSDPAVLDIARSYGVECITTAVDSGYSEDATRAITEVCRTQSGRVAVIPADLPLISHDDLNHINAIQEDGLILCPAETDGGTNALFFMPPLTIPLMFGLDSFSRYQQKAKQEGVPVTSVILAGFARDIDRMEDIKWLAGQPAGGRAREYARQLISEQT